MRLLFFFVILSSVVLGQAPEKESNFDLRSGLNLFMVEDLEQGKVLWLERTGNYDHFLHFKDPGDRRKLQKISSREASRLDREFGARFLRIQYELPPSSEGCKVTWRLTLKGEQIEVCIKDDLKSQEILPFVKNLEKHLL